MKDPHVVCPAFETDTFIMRRISEEDAGAPFGGGGSGR